VSPLQSRLLTVLVLAALVLGLATWLWEPPDPDREEGADAFVWDVEMDAVTGVRIERPDDVIELRKQGDRWRLVAPTDAAADPSRVDFLLVGLTRLDWGIPLTDVPVSDLGLEPPRATIVLTTADGAEHRLVVGAEAPVGGRTYARAADGTPIALAFSIEEAVVIQASDLRDATVLWFDPALVRRVSLTGPEGVVEVTGSGKRWWVAGYSRADVTRVEDLIFGLRSLRFLSFTADPAPGGFEAPEREVIVETGTETLRLQLGGVGPLGQLARTDAGVAGYLDPEELALIRQGPPELGDRSAFVFDRERDASVEVSLDGRTVRLSRGEAGWAGDLDAAAVSALLTAVNDARIHYLRAPPPAIGTVVGSVVVVDDVGGARAVDLGGVVDGYVIAQDRDGGGPYRIPEADVAAIRAALSSP
jgi:hypothetical protein